MLLFVFAFDLRAWLFPHRHVTYTAIICSVQVLLVVLFSLHPTN